MMQDSEKALPLWIDIVSDVVCPWCIIGYKQLEKALASMPGVFDISVHWQPFELNPAMPAEGQDLREHLVQKYGTTPQQSHAARERMSAVGESLGFQFDYFEGMRMVNTFQAHQLLHWAAEQGLQTELKLALFEAFFSNRQDVSDIEVLVASAAKVGLSAEQAAAVLAEGRYAEQVRSEQQYWQDNEVYAVPTFRFNGKYQVAGAQESETFVRVLNKLLEREAA